MDASQSATAADQGRRVFLKKSLVVSAAAAALGNLPGLAQAEPLSQRYPDPLINILDPSFMDLRIFNASVEKLATGLRWAEGPVWVGDGRYLLVSDIPNNRIVRWDEITGSLSVYRENSNFSNGMCRDRQGRLLVCEGSTTASEGRRITRTEHNGTITVLADSFEGKPLNSPNDIVCKRDGSVWFTDPPFQTGNNYEGHKVTPAQPHAVYRIDGGTGKVSRVIDEPGGAERVVFFPGRENPLRGRRPGQAQPLDLGNHGQGRWHAGGAAQAHRRPGLRGDRWNQVRRERQPLVRLGRQWRPQGRPGKTRRCASVQP